MRFVGWLVAAVALLGSGAAFVFHFVDKKTTKKAGTKAVWWYSPIIVAVIVGMVPVIWTIANQKAPHPWHLAPLSTNWATLGTWLSGILTPAALLIAYWGVHNQTKIALQQMEEQRRANILTEQMNLISNIDLYALHLNKSCYRSVLPDVMFMDGNDRGTMGFLALVRNLEKQERPENSRDGLWGIDPEIIRRRPQYHQLYSDLRNYIDRMDKTGLLGMVDKNIRHHYNSIMKHPPLMPMSEE